MVLEMEGGRNATASRFYAHTVPGDEARWEPLEVHLMTVAKLAASFSAAFSSAEWGYLAGLWHDLGKYQPEFLARLRGSREQIEHAGVGAVMASRVEGGGPALAFAIAGHHCGLANLQAQGDTRLIPLKERLRSNEPRFERILRTLPAEFVARPTPSLPEYLVGPSPVSRYRCELWTRMLFSALVDADRLSTEAFYDDGAASRERGRYPGLDTLRSLLNERLARFSPDTEVNLQRARVLKDCRSASQMPGGFFSLTAPTGTGKTLSTMAFALDHALCHSLRRVIVAVPYTSIIEQNARVYREALGEDAVIEHHSNVDEESRLEECREREVRRRLAAENWDAPIVVTTTVQLFESLLSNHPSRCRKLHNVAKSVIILDEPQSLPAGYLTTMLDVQRDLVGAFGCSIVFSTATQPAFGRRESLPEGIAEIHEIVSEPLALASTMKRVSVRWPQAEGRTSYSSLALELSQREQVLAVVHLRKDARVLAELLPEDGLFHLSALMCAAHRTAELERVREALNRKDVCRLVSTQLVEAGVDIDFPVVYRAMAGLDSLAQAAGRCNREGSLAMGEFIVFRAETRPPDGIPRRGLEIAEGMLARYGDELDLTGPNYFNEYFRQLYFAVDRDKESVQPKRENFNFADVDRAVTMIEDHYRKPIVVPWGNSRRRLDAYSRNPTRSTLRALQPFLVSISEKEFKLLDSSGALVLNHETVWSLLPSFSHLYGRFGLQITAR